ncbi:MAG: FxsA family protein [Parvibaculaceae bacterium]
MRFLLLLLLIGVPVLEITLFIKVGALIGVLPAFLLVFAVSALGAGLLRRQGLQSFSKVRSAMAQGEAPVEEVFDGFFLVAAAVLFILPGFFTDLLGLALLVPAVRKLLKGHLRRRFIIRTTQSNFYERSGFNTASQAGGPVIEGEAVEIPDEIDAGHRLPPKN